MRSRVLRITAALLIGILGTVVLLSYVRSAQDRAVAAEQTIPAFTVRTQIPAGTPIEQIATQVDRAEVPLTLANDAQVRDLADHAGTVATVDLVPGELLVTSRLATPEQLEAAGKVEIPDDSHQLTFSLDPQRVAGGQIAAGSRVGVFVSLDGEQDSGGRTRLVFDDVLVTTVQRDDSPPDPAASENAAGPPPPNNLLVTLALPGAEAADAVFGAEFGRLWLSVQGPNAAGGPRPLTTTESIFR